MVKTDSFLYFDPFSNFTCLFDGKEFRDASSRGKKSVIGSRVSYGNAIIHSFKIPKTTTPEEIKTLCEIKMYEEAGLDLQKKYKIIYILKELELEDNVLIEACAIDENEASITLKDVLKKEDCVDFLALPFLTFGSLYSRKILAPSNDLFVYIAENEAFLAIYKNGKYISTKSIMDLSEIAQKITSDGISIDAKALLELLSTKGLDASQYDASSSEIFNALEGIFSDIFTKIKNVLMHNRNIFGFESIDRIFFGIKGIPRLGGLKKFLQEFGFEAKINDLNLLKNPLSNDYLSHITAFYIQDKLSSGDGGENITPFKRKPPFAKTYVGKLTVSFIGFMALASLYPFYLTVEKSTLDIQLSDLNQRYDKIKQDNSKHTEKLKIVTTQLDAVVETKKDQERNMQTISKSIDTIYMMQKQAKSQTDFILKVNELLKKYTLKVKSIEQINSQKMNVFVIAEYSQRDKIAKFMEDLIAEGFSSVDTKEVKIDNQTYVSKVEIER
ncbi:MAG: hypothetical protein PHN38_09150 [Sulfurospirillaceae bacterium]|nr:hypothetical protein [Sulfurospirillaceae bacterium]